ncbi:hypothetical protein [Rhodanobacter denitrificans]|uniref:hypothetical protein n=1 Tax=Rhodanobacter denitrificans TaxID=666685 RepID=UPI000260E606|nr:hypothetical protein UUC_07281 [Rhodanobacter denitrificans]KZC20372.1 hypothetical protein RHOFW104R3_26065 [Rhodanobacter denitrificans]
MSAMLHDIETAAAPLAVHGLIHCAGDHALGALLGDLGARARCIPVQQRALPAVVLGLVADAFEAAFRIGGGAAALERARRGELFRGGRQWRGTIHRGSVARRRLSRRDIFARRDPARAGRAMATL